ncbi:GNAT family N-acetyltransferase [Uruburuella testudinis]|uniref:GNAT family N-acetyltransferase n=1 Tax=Uruburuella testudinis TaxID=1282863 RepID=A0ABY4DR85_9NEIS|nr:GNAT family N-acetyltransferase [Uruburuella testudinis]UOO81560.1 GNAT family N-acetyltransferase [Uruburuella testudinis]
MAVAIKLQKFTENDFDDYCRLVGNEQVMAMITERAIVGEEAQRDFAAIMADNRRHPVYGHFKITDADTQDFIGLAKLVVQADDVGQAEIGYMLMPQYWGKGIGSAVAAELIRTARRSGLPQLYAVIDPDNLPSRKILTKQGFIHREFKDFDGLPGEILMLPLE